MRTDLRTLSAISILGSMFLFAGCSVNTATGGAQPGASDELVGAPEDDGTDGRGAESVVGSVSAGSELKTTASLNLRNGPSTSAKILHVIPQNATVTVVSGTPSSGWYNIQHAGVTGWSFGVYLDKVSGGGSSGGGSSGGGGSSSGGSTGSAAVDAGIAKAKAGVGFSYWWGHARWSMGGTSSASAGSCSGSCPSCSHGGLNGADCSGYVAKIWDVPGSNADVSSDSHPYSTGNFIGDTSLWSTVSRGSVKRGDALVHNSGGSGHIFLYDSGDGWGSMWAYEAKGCSYGIQHDLRSASSAYHAIRRTGW